MRQFLLLTLFFTFSSATFAQVVNIPDPQFKSFLTSREIRPIIDTNADGEIQVTEAAAVVSIDIFWGSITNFTGLEAFVNLEILILNGVTYQNQLDLSTLTMLKHLEIPNSSGLTPIFPSGTALEYLNLESSRFHDGNLNSLFGLKYLNCTDVNGQQFSSSFAINMLNNLETLIIKGSYNLPFNAINHPNLIYLDCEQTQMQTLDVSNLANLETLICSFNRIETLDIVNLTSLKTLECNSNNISTLAVDNLTLLERLDCAENNIASLNVENLVNLNYLNCRRNNITIINLVPLTNLTNLNVSYNQLQNLNVATLISLTNLSCSNALLTNLDVNNLTNLTDLDVSDNPLGVINISNLTDLRSLNCISNGLTSLDVSNATMLETLYCDNNQLTQINTQNLTELLNLNCGNNQITSLDLSNNHKLNYVSCTNNLFTTLDFSYANDVTIPYFTFSLNDNPLLTYVNMKNGRYIIDFNGGTSWNLDCPNLRYVCADEFNIERVQNTLQRDGLFNIQVNSYCTFSPSGVYNTITGTLRMDLDGNGCDINDATFPNIKVGINDGGSSGAGFTNTSGIYSFFTSAGDFVLTPEIQNPYFTLSPTTRTVNLADVDGTIGTADFCLSPNGIHKDLDIRIFSLTPARPGFDATYSLIYKNKGNQTLQGTVNLNFNDAVLDLIVATPSATAQTLGNLSWNYSNLQPFESRTIDFTMNVNSPMETPPVNLDDILNFTAAINPTANDETIVDNVYEFPQIVVGSFDPNDKTCLEGNTFSPDQVGDYLHYLIRFQNSGTFAAQNVVVKDVIDAAKFDVNTLQLVASSHPNETRIKDNKVEFIFENINLPAEIDDEPGSHGYVIFKIKTNANLVLGNSVSNTAEIYFDYNFPIITKTATSTVAVLGKNDYENTSVKIYPNPVKDMLTISAKDNITSIQLYDIQGRLLEVQTSNSNNITLDISQKVKGLYLVKVNTLNGIKIEKILKE